MKRIGRQVGTAIVLGAEPTKAGTKVKLEVQLIGGGVETLFPTLDEFRALGKKPGDQLEIECSFTPYGSAETVRAGNDGKEFTDRFTTYRMRTFLPRRAA